MKRFPPLRCLACLVIMVCLSTQVLGQVFDEKFEHWPLDLKINGRLALAGQLGDPALLKQALERRGPNSKDERFTLLLDGELDESLVASYRKEFAPESDSPATFTVVRIVDQPEEFVAQLDELLPNCDVLCWHAARPPTDAERSAWVDARPALQAHLARGRTLAVIGPVAKLLSAWYTTANEHALEVTNGLQLVPDSVIETDYDHDGPQRGRLLSVLALQPRCVGIGLEKETVLLLDGRMMRVFGSGKATFQLMANERQPVRVQTIAEPSSPRQPPEDYLVDLTEWRRDAMDRTLEPFPPAQPETPRVEHGSLVIVGGGGMPSGLMARFVELAGGAEQARLVYVPCAEEDTVSETQGTVESWKKMGVQHATFLHTKDRQRANGDEEFLAPLQDATGIWFGGGRQWNLADSYYGTKAHQLMKDVLRRGGVIGGSSAGASIQARYLARATPIGNFRIMAPGYERGGLGFISGVAIDQHFTQRGRQKDMTQLVNRYPQLLGIGLDEATAIIVQQSTAEVVGRGKAHFYDRNLPVYPDRPDYHALPAGSSFDLAARKILLDTTPAEAAADAGEPAAAPPQ